jgi:iron complex outermembrane recepter protein
MLMQPLLKRHVLTATALATGLYAMPAKAAEEPVGDQAQAPAEGLAEILVTAQRREENLQATPISISVMKAGDIANRHIQSLLDLQDGSIPSLNVAPYSGRPFSLILNIRGVGVMADTNQPGRDSGVGVYIDDVYIGRPQGLNGALYDLEGIEVLKGPQGTLFGRNTEGGALNITTKKPTGKFGLEVTGGAGNYGSYEGEVHLNLPEWHNFSVKVDGLVTSRDGTVRNPYPGASDFNGYYRRGVHLQVKWQPDPDFSALYSYDNVYDSSTVQYAQKTQAGSGFTPAIAIQPDRADAVDYAVPLQPSIGTQFGHALTLKWDVSPHLKLKSISSYREMSQTQYDAGEVNYYPFTFSSTAPASAADNTTDRYSLAAFYQYQYSQELQLLGDIGRLKFVLGGLAYHEHVRDQAQAFNAGYLSADGSTFIANLPGPGNLVNNYANPNTGAPLPITTVVSPLYPYAGVDRASVVSTDSFGLYGQATWTPPVLQDRLHLTGGMRWSDDRKAGSLLLTNNYAPLNHDGSYQPVNFDKSWGRVDPMVNLAVDLAHDIQAYGKWGTGYKSGGANSRSLNYLPFGPESVSMFEVGLKSEFLDHRARFNIAGYTGTYMNQQVDFTVPYYTYANGVPVLGTGGVRTTTNTYNTPDHGRVSGVEIDLSATPARGLVLSGAYAYNYVRVGAAVDPFPQLEPDGHGGVVSVIDTTPTPQQQINTPMHSASGQIDYEARLAGHTARAHLDAAWDSGSYGSTTPSIGYANVKSQPGIVFNGRLSLGDIELANSGAKLTVSFWVRNLFNEQHLAYRYYDPYTGVVGIFNDPRTYGFQGTIRF